MVLHQFQGETALAGYVQVNTQRAYKREVTMYKK